MTQTNDIKMVVTHDRKERQPINNTYTKLVVQWLHQALCFVSSSLLADSLVLRNRQLLVAANRYGQVKQT
jgi:hypothetical protein